MNIKQLFSSKKKIMLAIFVSIILFGYLSSLVNSYMNLRQSDVRLEEAIEKKKSLESEKSKLLEQLEIATSNEFVEFQAREKLGLVKEGEFVVILPDEEILRRLSPRKAQQENFELPQPNWRIWGEVLFGV